MKKTGVAFAAAAVLFTAAEDRASPQQRPSFRTSTDIVAVDVQVSARDGTPVDGLKPEQFEVFIDGRRRAVQSVEFLRTVASVQTPGRGAPASPVPTPAVGAQGRLFMLGIDQMSFPASAQWSAREAAQRVVSRLQPEDSIGMVAFPGEVRIAPTRDRAVINGGIRQIAGLRGSLQSQKFDISAAEASLLKSKDSMSIAEIYARECERRYARDVFGLQTCRQELIQEGTAIATALEQQGLTSINGLHDVIDAMAPAPDRKTLVVVSAGIPLSNRPGGQPNLDHELARLARRAAAANVNLYVFYMNVHFLRYFSAEYGKQNHTIFDDISLFGYGLEKFADGAGGSFAQVEVDSDPFVDRVMRETSAYYLLAVPTAAADRDGKEHTIRVSVKQRGTTVQYRKVVVVPKG